MGVCMWMYLVHLGGLMIMHVYMCICSTIQATYMYRTCDLIDDMFVPFHDQRVMGIFWVPNACTDS